MKLVEIDGSHTVQNEYISLDIHVGQCYSVLVMADQTPGDYYIAVSTRFSRYKYTSTGVVRYAGSNSPPSPVLPPAPVSWAWSLNQRRSFRWNLTASAARPNPQGSYRYGSINITRTIKLTTSSNTIDHKLRYFFNKVSHVEPDTPLKLAVYFNVTDDVFTYNYMKDAEDHIDVPAAKLTPNVITVEFRTFVEIIIEKSMQAFHLDGYSFFPVG